MELEAFDEGTVAKLAVGEGQSVGVGEVIAVLAEEGEDASEAAGAASAPATSEKKADEPSKAASEGSSEPRQPATASTAVAEPKPSQSENGATDRVFASPLARKVAEESGVDLRRVDGTGPSGRIVKKDVEAAMAGGGAMARAGERAPTTPAPQAAPLTPVMEAPSLESRIVTLSNMRGTIAKRLVESKTTIPHYQVTLEVAMEPLLELRETLNEQLETQGVKLTVNDFIVRACALGMHEHPFVNARWLDSKGEPAIEILGDVNIGVAIALPIERGGGLVVATLRNADRLGLRQISAETKRLAKKAREKGLTIEEMSDSTFTVSNLGMFGVEHFTAIINPPNAAILAVGGAIQKPVVVDDQVIPGWRMQMTMSSDHRIIDGAMAAQYLGTVRELLENPATLLV
jgi:pyruvate dehydrogenase E2 component (dihydrolipoamide acetyltransferase)